MADQDLVQAWQPFYMTLAGASAALAGLVFIAMSLHPRPTLVDPLMRVRAVGAASGFLIGVAWALTMLLPAHTAPAGSILLLTVGVGGGVFIVLQQLKVRRLGASVSRVILGDLLVLAPMIAGLVGLLVPESGFPFLLLAIASGVGIFVLFSQSWSLVMHSVMSVNEPSRPESRGGEHLTALKEDNADQEDQEEKTQVLGDV